MTDTTTKTVNDYLHDLRSATASLSEYTERIATETAEARATIAKVEGEYAPIVESLRDSIAFIRTEIEELMLIGKVEKVRDAKYLAFFKPLKKRELIDLTAAKDYLEELDQLERYLTIDAVRFVKDHPDAPGVRTSVNMSLTIKEDTL